MSESRYDPRYDPRAPEEERPRPFSELPPPPPDVVPSGEVYDWYIRGCDLLDLAPDGRIRRKDSYWKIVG